MSVRRGATWLGTACVLLGTTVALGAAPAVADGESVRVRAPSTINAGGSPGSVTVNVSMRDGACVNVRTVLGVRLPGLTAERVEVQVAADGGWRRVQVSEGADGLVVAERTTPDRPVLCARRSVSSRYRVSLLAGAPDGRVTVVAEAYAASGRLLGRHSDSARVTGRTGAATEDEPTLAAPSATPEATEDAAEDAATEPTQEVADAALPGPTRAAVDESGGSLGLGSLVMVVGVVMVGIGIALLVLLIRRGRADRGGPVSHSVPSSDADPTARIVLLGAEPTARFAPVDAEPTARFRPVDAEPTARFTPAGAERTARFTPVSPVFRPGGPTDGAGPVGGGAGQVGGTRPVGGAGQVGAGAVGDARSNVGPAVGDRTLILPTAGRIPPRTAGPVPIGVVPPEHAATAPADRPGSAPPGRFGGTVPRQGGPVPPEQPPVGGPDVTLILPPTRRPPQ